MMCILPYLSLWERSHLVFFISANLKWVKQNFLEMGGGIVTAKYLEHHPHYHDFFFRFLFNWKHLRILRQISAPLKTMTVRLFKLERGKHMFGLLHLSNWVSSYVSMPMSHGKPAHFYCLYLLSLSSLYKQLYSPHFLFCFF